MAEAVERYVEATGIDRLPRGEALFTEIVKFARNSTDGKYLADFQTESAAYVAKVYANALALAEDPKEG